ncbi:MAG: SOS response-associated peptidase family protein, partial [Candidatus Competibacteraceae bacterium]|nr:SOS response-associated peptidase family protein [Candidatus Competibacteraceae bacterium]
MCGRFIQCTSGEALAERFHLPIIPDLTPRYNVAPSQSVGVIRVTHAGHREFVALRWGLVPAWSPEPRTAYSTFNA